MVLGSCVAAGAWCGRDSLGRPGSGRQRHQGDIEEALAVRRRRWAAWRGGAWSSSCDHAATSSAVLFDPGLVPQLQFIDRVDGVRDGVLLVLPSVVHRDRSHSAFPLAGSGCCSH